MSYRDEERLDDIAAAIAAISAHVERGGLGDGLIFDAVRIRLLEIGEAVKALPAAADAGGRDADRPYRRFACGPLPMSK